MTCPHWEHSSGEDTDGDCGHEIYYKLGCDNCPLVLANYQQEAENAIHKLNAKQADKNLSLSLGGYTLQEVSDKFRNGYISREQAEKYVKAWNDSGKHFTTAKIYAFSIGNK